MSAICSTVDGINLNFSSILLCMAPGIG
jgi:hypothetical protein